MVGAQPRIVDPDREAFTAPDAVLASATATGLVGIDANGQVEPALAESWIVTADGQSIVFRIRDTVWADGSAVTSAQVAHSLNAALAADSRNRLRPLLSAIQAIVPMTGSVVEIRLKSARPNLLQLLAQPELDIRKGMTGGGPFRIVGRARSRLHLETLKIADDPDVEAGRPYAVDLTAETAALSIVRFVAGKSDLVLGGTLADFPLLQAAGVRPGRLRLDPVQGLFGLAVSNRSSALAAPDLRKALSMAVDRNALAKALGIAGWTITTNVLPGQLDSARAPAAPDWDTAALDQRRQRAQALVSTWRASHQPATIRVALPRGAGMRILFARLAADWRRIGVQAIAVSPDDRDADLRLIDAVAPNASANWYLTTLSCEAGLICDDNDDMALIQSRQAETLNERANHIADADAIIAARASFIPLGVPIRWSLVDPGLTGWKENIFAVHPLNELRPPSGN